MANFVYDKARQRFLEGDIKFLIDTIKVQLLSTVTRDVSNNVTEAFYNVNNTDPLGTQVASGGPGTGTYSLNYAQLNHQFLSQVPAAARISNPQILGSKTSTNGNADGGDLAFPTVTPAGVTIEAYLFYKDTGVESTSPLIAYVDVATNLPIIANGGTINLLFNGARIFRI